MRSPLGNLLDEQRKRDCSRSKLLEEQLDSLMGQHGARAMWLSLSLLCVTNAETFKDRGGHVSPIWAGFAAHLTAMWLTAKPLDSGL